MWVAVLMTPAKRIFDIMVPAVLLVIFGPLLAVVAVLLPIFEGRPLFYISERMRDVDTSFQLIKFRTMSVTTADGGVTGGDKSGRISRAHRLLRRTRLDEVPQLWNVLRGDMSFVGPRPERPYFVEQLSQEIPFYQHRHGVRPGITGWAQVKFSYGASVEDSKAKLGYDLYYVRQANLFLDLLVLIKTIRVILFGDRWRYLSFCQMILCGNQVINLRA